MVFQGCKAALLFTPQANGPPSPHIPRIKQILRDQRTGSILPCGRGPQGLVLCRNRLLVLPRMQRTTRRHLAPPLQGLFGSAAIPAFSVGRRRPGLQILLGRLALRNPGQTTMVQDTHHEGHDQWETKPKTARIYNTQTTIVPRNRSKYDP